jgi:hypothetical protein
VEVCGSKCVLEIQGLIFFKFLFRHFNIFNGLTFLNHGEQIRRVFFFGDNIETFFLNQNRFDMLRTFIWARPNFNRWTWTWLLFHNLFGGLLGLWALKLSYFNFLGGWLFIGLLVWRLFILLLIFVWGFHLCLFYHIVGKLLTLTFDPRFFAWRLLLFILWRLLIFLRFFFCVALRWLFNKWRRTFLWLSIVSLS